MGVSKFETRYKEQSNPNGKAVAAAVLVVVIVVLVVLVVVVVVIVVTSAAAVLTGVVPNLIILESGLSKHLNLLICAICVFVLHRRYTNISRNVTPDGLHSAATHLVTCRGLLQH